MSTLPTAEPLPAPSARRYPRELFDPVVGIARWTRRVPAFAARMRDAYPRFRLGR